MKDLLKKLNAILAIFLALAICYNFSKIERTVRYGDPILFDLYRLHNEYRESKGLTHLQYNQKLAQAAQKHSEWMAEKSRMSHTGKNRSSPGDRIKEQGYSWRSCAENIAYGYRTPQAAMEGWKDSPGHNRNILGKNLQIGVGYAEASDGTLYWTTNFATPGGVYFPFDIRSKNIAVLFTMTNENGRRENLSMMKSVFEDGALGFEHESYHNVPSTEIYRKLTELAEKVGEYGTLLAYFNSHGGGSDFHMTAREGNFKFSKALEAIAKGNKVKRLIMLIDTCHASGGIREGGLGREQPINPSTGLPEIKNFYGNDSAYEECLVVASSSVEDLSIRGAFANRLKRAFGNVRGQEDITVREFLRHFASLHSNTKQKPHYKVLPDESILDEPLFTNPLIRNVPIIDRNSPQGEFPPDYIPYPME